MLGTEFLRDDIGVGEFVALQPVHAFEADGKGLQVFLPAFRKQCDEEGRVEAAGEKYAKRHVGNTAALDSGPQTIADRFRPFALGKHAILRAHRATPVNFLALRAVRLDDQQCSGGEFLHALEDRARCRHGAVKT